MKQISNMWQSFQRAIGSHAGTSNLPRYQSIVDNSRDAMLLMRDDFQLLLVNPACRTLLGLKPGQTHSAFLKYNLSFEPDINIESLKRLCLSGGIAEHQCTRRDGAVLDIELSAGYVDSTLLGAGGQAGHKYFSLTLHDVSEHKALEKALRLSEERLRHETLHDQLTGLANRKLFFERLGQANEQKKILPDHRFAVFFLDLDRFKQVNDTFGHHAGDEMLVEATRRLKKGLESVETLVCPTDGATLARLSGDEFVVLLNGFESINSIQWLASILINALNAPYHYFGREVRLSVSIGVATPDDAYAELEDIVRDADYAMYQAKRMGGGRVCYFSSMLPAAKTAIVSPHGWGVQLSDSGGCMFQTTH